jgi:hypothetical protein
MDTTTRRWPRLLSGATLLLLLIATVPGPLVSAAASKAETITLVRGPARDELGWTASGTFTDGCAKTAANVCWTTDRAVFSGGPHFVVGQVLTTMIGASGSFGLRFEGQDRMPDLSEFSGQWEVIAGSGTGAYARLNGHGKWTWAFEAGTGNGVFTLTGVVQLI